MPKMVDDEINIKGLEQIVRSFKKIPQLQVGILGAKDARADQGSNAAIGLKHEFGQDGMPIRSFLRMPLTMKLDEALKSAGALEETVLKLVIKQGTLVPFLEKVGIVAEAVIADAFDTGGFGQWKPSNFKLKKNHQTLVETQQLRNSITSKVVE